MASGFLVLPDGRCLARRMLAHDEVVRAIANEVVVEPLRKWLLEQLPGPDDELSIGYGPWFRKSDRTIVPRIIDVRLMTLENQQLFCDAVKRAALVHHDEEWPARSLSDFADMISRMERGELPHTKSDWIHVLPPRGERIGPGWPAE